MTLRDTQQLVNVAGVDWDAAWRAYDATRDAPGDEAHWDRRSATYGDMRMGPYEWEFLDRAGIEPGSTVLDFGCGIGLLTVPLAQRGCRVVACDFSRGMLDRLRAHVEAAGVSHLVELHKLAWDDDWAAAGIGPGFCDYAIASRSLATPHMAASLAKLDEVARRRAFTTVAASQSPRRDERAFAAVGRERPWSADYIYCLNILLQHGAFPELSYIVTHSRPAFADRDEALAGLTAAVGGGLTAQERAALEAFVDAHYAENPQAKPGRTFEADVDREVRWAFIAWDTRADG
jgi:SAM-dependent methyltransferase